MTYMYAIFHTYTTFIVGMRSMQEERFLKGSDILILKKSQNVFFYSCNSTLLMGLFSPCYLQHTFFFAKIYDRLYLRKFDSLRYARGRHHYQKEHDFGNFNILDKPEQSKKKLHRDGTRREFQDAVWEMALETLGERKSKTLTAVCQLILSPINH